MMHNTGTGSVSGSGSVDAENIAGQDVLKGNLTMNITQPPSSGVASRLDWLTDAVFKMTTAVAELRVMMQQLHEAPDCTKQLGRIEEQQAIQREEIRQLKRSNTLLFGLIVILALAVTVVIGVMV